MKHNIEKLIQKYRNDICYLIKKEKNNEFEKCDIDGRVFELSKVVFDLEDILYTEELE
jgi:hypothetical protein